MYNLDVYSILITWKTLSKALLVYNIKFYLHCEIKLVLKPSFFWKVKGCKAWLR